MALTGERPVVLFHGGPGDAVAVQFVERNERLVGTDLMRFSQITSQNISVQALFVLSTIITVYEVANFMSQDPP